MPGSPRLNPLKDFDSINIPIMCPAFSPFLKSASSTTQYAGQALSHATMLSSMARRDHLCSPESMSVYCPPPRPPRPSSNHERFHRVARARHCTGSAAAKPCPHGSGLPTGGRTRGPRAAGHHALVRRLVPNKTVDELFHRKHSRAIDIISIVRGSGGVGGVEGVVGVWVG